MDRGREVSAGLPPVVPAGLHISEITSTVWVRKYLFGSADPEIRIKDLTETGSFLSTFVAIEKNILSRTEGTVPGTYA